MDKKGAARLVRAKLREKDGASLLIAVVITLCMVMLALSVLLTSYSLFTSVNKRATVRQCHELALSLSEAMEQQITAKDLYGSIESANDFLAAMNAPSGIQSQYPLWFFLRTNLRQGEIWRWFDEDDIMHLEDVAWRTYQVEGAALPGYTLEVTLYWVSDKEAEELDFDPAVDDVMYSGSGPDVVVMVKCSNSNGTVKSTVTSRYGLTVDRFETTNNPPTAKIDGKTICINEKWSFELLTRR